MLKCKKCGSEKITKNGFVRKNQRWRCKDCGYNFIVGDKPQNSSKESVVRVALLYNERDV